LLNNKKIFENIKKYDKIIPVPISKKRYKERGYNQSLLIAKEISKQMQYKANIENKQKEKTNLELVNNCLIKTKNIIEQSKLNKEERQNNIQGVYSLQNPQKITNQKILLVDDIYTTGSTVNECSKILKQANPKTIGVLVLAKD
jgi:competence protein ComFC